MVHNDDGHHDDSRRDLPDGEPGWGSGVRAIVGSTTLALFLAILGVVLIEGPESGLPRFTTSNPVHVALVVAIVLYIPPLIVNRMEPGVFEWDKAAHVAMTEEDSDGEDEKLIAADDDSPIYGAAEFSDDPGAPSPECWPGSRTTTPCSGCEKTRHAC